MLILRADAGPKIGAGHFMRCLALAEAWQERGGNAIFLTRCDSDVLLKCAEDRAVRLKELPPGYTEEEDLRRTLALLRSAVSPQANPWLCTDGYFFSPKYHAAIRSAGFLLLVIDDEGHLPRYEADILLNQNLDADQLSYSTSRDTLRLLGTRYALLRSEFRNRRTDDRHIPDVARRVLVTLGGSDPENVTMRVIQALERCSVDSLECAVIAGGASPHRLALAEAVDKARREHGLEINLLTEVGDMPALMAWADLAISAAGSTCWELCYMGLPAVLLVIAENQHGIAAGVARRNAAVNLGPHERVTVHEIAEAINAVAHDVDRRSAVSREAGTLVDGLGPERVISALKNYEPRALS